MLVLSCRSRDDELSMISYVVVVGAVDVDNVDDGFDNDDAEEEDVADADNCPVKWLHMSYIQLTWSCYETDKDHEKVED